MRVNGYGWRTGAKTCMQGVSLLVICCRVCCSVPGLPGMCRNMCMEGLGVNIT